MQVRTIHAEVVTEAAISLGLVTPDATPVKKESILPTSLPSSMGKPNSIVDRLIENMKHNRGVAIG
jgi:hypothetical protein